MIPITGYHGLHHHWVSTSGGWLWPPAYGTTEGTQPARSCGDRPGAQSTPYSVVLPKRVYGVAGDSLNGLTDSIRTHDGIDWMMVRHEEVAAFAAGGESQITGELTVCAGSCGPGNLGQISIYSILSTHSPGLKTRTRHSAGNSGCWF